MDDETGREEDRGFAEYNVESGTDLMQRARGQVHEYMYEHVCTLLHKHWVTRA